MTADVLHWSVVLLIEARRRHRLVVAHLPDRQQGARLVDLHVDHLFVAPQLAVLLHADLPLVALQLDDHPFAALPLGDLQFEGLQPADLLFVDHRSAGRPFEDLPGVHLFVIILLGVLHHAVRP